MFSWRVLFSSGFFLCDSPVFSMFLFSFFLACPLSSEGSFPLSKEGKEQGTKHIHFLLAAWLSSWESASDRTAGLKSAMRKTTVVWFVTHCRKKDCCMFSFLMWRPPQSSTPIRLERGFPSIWCWTVSWSGN